MSLFELTILAPWACILIYVAVFIASAFIMLQIDWGKYFRKEMRTPLMGMLCGLIMSLVVTFCIGTLLIIFSSLFMAMF